MNVVWWFYIQVSLCLNGQSVSSDSASDDSILFMIHWFRFASSIVASLRSCCIHHKRPTNAVSMERSDMNKDSSRSPFCSYMNKSKWPLSIPRFQYHLNTPKNQVVTNLIALPVATHIPTLVLVSIHNPRRIHVISIPIHPVYPIPITTWPYPSWTLYPYLQFHQNPQINLRSYWYYQTS